MNVFDYVLSTADEKGMILIGEVALNLTSQQSQYLSHYFGGVLDAPDLTEGLLVEINHVNYHGCKIHKSDLLEFMVRYNAHMAIRGVKPVWLP